MASYNELNALIDAYINRNGVQAITGQILNGVLKAMVEQLGRGYTIMGSATPTTDPGTPDGPECYFASETGTYTDFDGLQIVPGELALLCYTPSDGWTKETIYEGFQTVQATIDENVGTPSVGVSYANGVLSFDFHNMKGNPGQNGQDGQDGDPAGFGTIGADITGGVGTPGVTVESSGPATAKNLQFHFTNLKGETGVTSVVATVDNTTGNPTCTVSLVGQQLTLAFSGLKGAQGNTGSSVDYPFTIVNNLTTDDATQALSAAQGVVLQGEITQLEHDLTDKTIYTENSATPFAEGKYIYWQYGYQWNKATATISGLISLKNGQTIKVNIPQIVDANTTAIGVLKPNGVDFYGETGARSQTGVSDYEYTATADCQVAVCFTTAGGFTATVLGDFITEKVDELEDEVDELAGPLTNKVNASEAILDGYESVAIEIAQTGYGISTFYGTVVTQTGYCYSKPIWVNKGDKIKLSLSGGTPSSNYAAIIAMQYENARYNKDVQVRGDSAVFDYEWTATFATFVAVSFPTASTAAVVVKRVDLSDHINRVDEKEPTIVAPFHNAPADGSAGSTFDAETVTSAQLDAEAQRIHKNYSGMLSREVMGKDASGVYDVVRYICTKRDYFAYKAADALFAWKSAGDALLYTKSFCPVPGDTVYNSDGTTAGAVASYNSTNGAMTVSGTAYSRSTDDNIPADVVYLFWDLAEAYRADNNVWAFNSQEKGIFNRSKIQVGTYANSDFNLTTNVLTFNSKSYLRAPSYDFGREEEHTLVLWGNEHAPQSDPAEPSITLLKMMEDLSSAVAETNPLLRYIKNYCKVVFIPCVNPWGMTTRNNNGRLNYNGVNINRNYDYKWESVVTVAGESKGSSAGDQPETRYVMDTCALFGADFAMDVHCLGYGNYVNNVNYDAVFPAEGTNRTYLEMLREYNKYFRKMEHGNAESPGEGSGFICKNLGIGGGLIEMNAGIPYETLHCAGIMQMNYDFLFKTLRLFFKITAPNLYITR